MATIERASDHVVKQYIRNDSYVFKISEECDFKELEFTDLTWKTLAEINAERTVLDLSKHLKTDVNDVRFSCYELMQSDAIEVISGLEKNYIDPDYVKRLETEFVKIIGPVAGIIIDDVLNDMEMTRETIDKAIIYSFVEAVSYEIDDADKKLEFQKISLEFLKTVMD